MHTPTTQPSTKGTPMRGSSRLLVSFGGIALALLGGCAPAVEQEAAGLDGIWRTDGYGHVAEIDGDRGQLWEVTAISCLLGYDATVEPAQSPEDVDLLTIEALPGMEMQIEVLPGASPNERWMQPRGTASRRRMVRIDALPPGCGEQRDDAPFVFDVFWQSFEEHYPFFEMKGVDWQAVRDRERPGVTAETTDDELWGILQGILESLEDAHTYLATPDMTRIYHGQRPDPNPLDEEGRARAFALIDEQYLETPAESRCNHQIAIGALPGGVRYFRLVSFNSYGDDFLGGLDCLEGVLDDLLAEPESITGLVVDVRINGGGADPYGLAIASRLATEEYVAYTKQTRNDPEDPTSWTEGQSSVVRPTAGAGYAGPVVELTGINSVSAAETFTLSLMGRTPKVTRIGQNTQGVFSDVLGRVLPNGWRFGLSNERFLAIDGTNYEGPGIPPDISTPVFTPEELDAGRDSAIEKALEVIGSGA
jgi:C-terminal processing protease CtpA/Prc